MTETNQPLDYFPMVKQMSKNIPKEANWIVATLALVDLIETGPNLTEEQIHLLVGIAAMAYRQGFEEMQAGIGADRVITIMRKGAGNHE